MKLNYQCHGQGDPILLIHGLFGSLDNLGILANTLQQHYQVIQIDLRNHGLSPHSSDMNYQVMAQDVCTLLQQLNLISVTVIGHSMGGKVAMAMTRYLPELLARLIIIDIAPVAYTTRRHDDIFMALFAVKDAQLTRRIEAKKLMNQFIDQPEIIQFLLKSFQQGKWLFNLDTLYTYYDDLSSWQPVPVWNKPVLFICGADSPYVKRAYQAEIQKQFPIARAHVISGSGHWVHSERPVETLRTIQRFLDET